ncbi:hypothetical protein [Nonomuraea sp. NPDC050643]|uniref:hypothetical protein n=1 Tax=Nonomuraea sp. NPDC050643 TaxID=3155660 RepID=UPI0033CF9CD8
MTTSTPATPAAATAQVLAARIAADAGALAALLDPEVPAVFERFDGDYAAVLAGLGPALMALDRAVEHVYEVVGEISNDADDEDWDKVATAAGEAKEVIGWHGDELSAAVEHARRAQSRQASTTAVVQRTAADLRALYREAAGRA